MSKEPIFNVPGAILAMLAVLALVHGLRSLVPVWGTEVDEAWVTLALAFIPARYTGAMDQLPGGLASALVTPWTHMLVHADLTHLGLNAAWLLVFGSLVARRLGTVRLVAFTAVMGAVGALAFALVNWGAMLPMVGASGAVSGLMGGAIRLLFAVLRVGGVRGDVATTAMYVPLGGIAQSLRDRQVQIVILVTILLNLGLGATGSLLTPGSAGIAWEAHVGGFLAGLLGFGLIDPGPRPLPEPTADA